MGSQGMADQPTVADAVNQVESCSKQHQEFIGYICAQAAVEIVFNRKRQTEK